jgi:hypothetical protein
MKTLTAIAVSASLFAVGITHANVGNRLWVASYGDDNSPTCSFTAPCLSFFHAASIAPAGSEISCIDSVPAGGVIITKSMTINCEGQLAGNAVKTNPAAVGTVSIATSPTDIVVLRGLQLNFLDFGSGINFNASGTLILDKVHIGGANASGIMFQPNAPAKLIVTDSVIDSSGTGTTGAAIRVVPSGTGSAQVTLDRVRAVGNVFGIALDGTGSTSGINATIRDSVAASNTQDGIIAISASGKAPIGVLVTNSASINNQFGIRSIGPGVTVRTEASRIAGNGTGLAVSGGGVLLSAGNNTVEANAANGAFTGSFAFK